MRICYLPIFLALSTFIMMEISGQQPRARWPVDTISSQSKMAKIFQVETEMFVPMETLSTILQSSPYFNPKLYTNVPTDWASFVPLGSKAGKHRDFLYPWESEVNKFKMGLAMNGQFKKNIPSPYLLNHNNIDTSRAFVREEVPEENVAEISLIRTARSSGMQPKKDVVSIASEGDDMGAKGMETMTKGVEIASKGMESGEMAAKAGSDLAESGQAAVEGAAAGAGMISSGAETIGSGMEAGKNMLGG